MFTIEAILEDFALWVQFVKDRISVVALVVRENRYLPQLGHLLEKFSEVWPLIDVYVPAKLLILRTKKFNSNK